MLNQKHCLHQELMENFMERDKRTGKLTVLFYRCVDCGKQIDAKSIVTVPPSRSHKRVFAISE